MKKRLIVFVILLSFCCLPSIVAPVTAFDCAVVNADLPSGFELQSTTVETATMISQVWKTPSDTTGLTMMSCTNYTQTATAKDIIEGIKVARPDYNYTSVSGASEAVEVWYQTDKTIYARKGAFVAYSATITSEEADIKTLLSAQMNKIPGSSITPGFALITAIVAVAVASFLLKKPKK